MRRKGLTVLLAVALVVVIAAGAIFAVTHFTVIHGKIYPMNFRALDLRDQELTVAEFDAVAEKFPDSFLLWNIPFQGGYLSSDTKILAVTSLSWEDVERLDYAIGLETVDGTACTDYAQLLALQQRRPEIQVNYQVEINGVSYPQDTQKLELTGLTEEQTGLLGYLPELSQVVVSGCQDYDLLKSLQEEHPQWNLHYSVTLNGQEYAWDTETIQVENVTCEEVSEAMAAMPNLKSLTAVNPQGDGQILVELQETYPNVEMHWQVELYGQTVTEDITELDISGTQITSCEEVAQAVACLPNLEKLVMSDCGVDNETMAAFREQQREHYKVVWTVNLGTRKALGNRRYIRTDATKLWANCYYYDDELVNLKYCEDMVALDLGHTGVINLDFVAYMPELTYLIVADSGVQDLTPLESCKKLIWLELGWCYIKSYEPLLGCTALEDLNIGRTYADPTPISQMTWLKNLWCMDTRWESRQLWLETLTDTTIESSGSDVVAHGWRKLPNYYKMRDALGAYYMD